MEIWIGIWQGWFNIIEDIQYWKYIGQWFTWMEPFFDSVIAFMWKILT
jgi:hypothetical protein